jgi:hypothetical protein
MKFCLRHLTFYKDKCWYCSIKRLYDKINKELNNLELKERLKNATRI